MKYFKSIRMAYVEDLIVPHDFELIKPYKKHLGDLDQKDNLFWTCGYAMISSSEIVIDKSPTSFNPKSQPTVWYSQSLDLALVPEDIARYLNESGTQILLEWLYKNWSSYKHNARVPFSAILENIP